MRSFGVFVRHSLHAFEAASTARPTSSAEPRGTSAITSPVEGFSTSMVSPLDDSTHSPPMKCLCWVTETLTGRPPFGEIGVSVYPCTRADN